MSRDDQLENILEPLVALVRGLWRHREGYEQVGSILDVIDACKTLHTKSGEIPVLSHRSQDKERTMWRLCFTMPPGIPTEKFIELVPHMAEQSECFIESTVHKKTVILDLYKKYLPEKVSFSEWQMDKKLFMPIPIGRSLKEFIQVDLAEVIHVFVGGQPGFGKTNVMKSIALSLVGRAMVCVIDLKKVDYVHFKSYVLTATTVPQAAKVLMALNKELDRRLTRMQELGIDKIQSYKGDDMPYIVLVLDELAELQDKICQELLNRLSRLARTPGISLIVGTQRPSATIYPHFTDTRAMFGGVIALKTKDAVNSRMLLDNDLSAKLPKTKGRAIWQYQDDVEVQTPLVNKEVIIRHLPQVIGGKWVEFDQPVKRLPAR